MRGLSVITDLVPLQLIASEWGISADVLAREFTADQVDIDALGIRRVGYEAALEVLQRRQAKAAALAEADRERRADMARQADALRAHVTAIQHRDKLLRETGMVDPDCPALAVMAGADHEQKMTAAGQRFEEALTASRRGDYGVMHRLPPTEE